MRSPPLSSLVFAGALSLSGCAVFRSDTPPGDRPNSQFVSADDISRSGASNAWDLLRARARGYDFSEDRYGRPRSIKTRRGRSTFALSGADTPLIVIDGARLIDIATLRDLPSEGIESVELLSGIAGTASQGTSASAGVIYIHTWEASSAPGTIARR